MMSARALVVLSLTAFGLALAVVVISVGLAILPLSVPPDVAPPQADAPLCSWGVILDVHPDIAWRPDLVRYCESVAADRRRDVVVLLALSGGLAVTGLLLRRLSARSSASAD